MTLVNVNDERDIIVCDIVVLNTGREQIVCDTR